MDEKEKTGDGTKMARGSAMRDFCCVTRVEWEGTKRTKKASDWSSLSLFSQNGALFKLPSPHDCISNSRLLQNFLLLLITCSIL